MSARVIRVRGVVQGVGFRPFVYRLAHAHGLRGWVLNGESGVAIHAEGGEAALEAFIRSLVDDCPPAAEIESVEIRESEPEGFPEFSIRESERSGPPTVRIS
ncbi:MAG: acylphosphatase, partial [Bryobacteraceae bacterium]